MPEVKSNERLKPPLKATGSLAVADVKSTSNNAMDISIPVSLVYWLIITYLL